MRPERKKKKNSKNFFSKIAGDTLRERHRIRRVGDALRLLINPFGALYAPTVPEVVQIFPTFLIKGREESFLNPLSLPKKLIL